MALHQISQADSSQKKIQRFSGEDFKDSVFLWDFFGKISRYRDVIVNIAETLQTGAWVETFQKQKLLLAKF